MPALIRIAALATETKLPARKLRIIAGLGGAELWPGSRRWYLRSIADHVLHERPLSFGTYGELPAQPLLHRAQTCDWLGITDDQFTHMLRHLPKPALQAVCLPILTCKKRMYRRDSITIHILAKLLP